MAISLRADVAIHFSKGFNYVCDWKRRLHRLGDNYLTRSGSPRSVSVEFPAPCRSRRRPKTNCHGRHLESTPKSLTMCDARSRHVCSHLAHHAAAFAQFNHDVQDLRSRRVPRMVRAHMSNPAHGATTCFCAAFALHFVVNASVPGRGGGEAPVCASVCAPHARLCVITHARLPLTRSLLPPQHGGFRRPGLGGRDADRRALS
jgi:hypothetical protein